MESGKVSDMRGTTIRHVLLLILVAALLLIPGCTGETESLETNAGAPSAQNEVQEPEQQPKEEPNADADEEASGYDASAFLESIPEWEGFAFCYVNDNQPGFDEDEVWSTVQESLDPLDELGRCGTAKSCIGREGMPTEPRGDISSIEPTGWNGDRYDFVEGGKLYNRCHLIGHQLSGDDAIPRNLITGTSYMNRDGMLPFENAIASYVRETGNHVMYRVTPVFRGSELVARGVHLEAVSVEDEGEGLAFNVFCYNVQPGVDIDYATGDSRLSEDTTMLESYQAGELVIIPNTHGSTASAGTDRVHVEEQPAESQEQTYILNKNTGRFHYPDCRSVQDMAEHNKQEVESTREALIERGFTPCGNCRP